MKDHRMPKEEMEGSTSSFGSRNRKHNINIPEHDDDDDDDDKNSWGWKQFAKYVVCCGHQKILNEVK